ncbi:MAG: actin interacting protein 3-domain-containing protein [Piptocephalis tieghemiana]|nr:MAG: actin interacting protein 3-domain-containing protein [Piptocephalis tieghemiana]
MDEPSSSSSSSSSSSFPEPSSPASLSRSTARRLSRTDLAKRRSITFTSTQVGYSNNPGPTAKEGNEGREVRPRRSSASIRRLSTAPERLLAMSREVQAALSGAQADPVPTIPEATLSSGTQSEPPLSALDTSIQAPEFRSGPIARELPIPVPTPPRELAKTPEHMVGPPSTGLTPIHSTPAPIPPATSTATTISSSPTFTVYLTAGTRVKKAILDFPPSLSSVLMAFMDRFSLQVDPSTLPPILIKAPQTDGPFYELEDISDIQEYCILRLDQGEHHQSQISEKSLEDLIQKMSNEMSGMKELLEKTLASQQQLLRQALPASGALQPPPTPKKSALRDQHPTSQQGLPSATSPVIRPSPSRTSSITSQEDGMAPELASLRKELRDLRRELGVEKQLRFEEKTEADQTILSLRQKATDLQASLDKAIEQSPPSDRKPHRQDMIGPGMQRMDQMTEDVAKGLEEAQDLISELKLDVTSRGARPSLLRLQMVRQLMDQTEKEMVRVAEYVDDSRPRWKAAWEEELQGVMKERDFLAEQQDLLGDLEDDHRALTLVLEQLEKLVALQERDGPRQERKVSLNVLGPEEGFLALGNVMEEISCVVIDSERRMKAVEMNEKVRRWELENVKGEFEQELESFVEGKKLRRTGGAEEAERRREERAKKALMDMLRAAADNA